MRIKGLNIPLIFLSGCCFLGVLLLGQWTFQKYSVERPLIKEITAVDGVQEVLIKQDTKKMILEVKLQNIEGFPKTYNVINSLISAEQKSDLQIRLLDKRDEKLAQLWNQSQFIIYEAIVKGNYTAMSAKINSLMEQAKLDRWEISMDAQNIYLELHAGNNYLYEIVPRTQNQLEAGSDSTNGAN